MSHALGINGSKNRAFGMAYSPNRLIINYTPPSSKLLLRSAFLGDCSQYLPPAPLGRKVKIVSKLNMGRAGGKGRRQPTDCVCCGGKVTLSHCVYGIASIY